VPIGLVSRGLPGVVWVSSRNMESQLAMAMDAEKKKPRGLSGSFQAHERSAARWVSAFVALGRDLLIPEHPRHPVLYKSTARRKISSIAWTFIAISAMNDCISCWSR